MSALKIDLRGPGDFLHTGPVFTTWKKEPWVEDFRYFPSDYLRNWKRLRRDGKAGGRIVGEKLITQDKTCLLQHVLSLTFLFASLHKVHMGLCCSALYHRSALRHGTCLAAVPPATLQMRWEETCRRVLVRPARVKQNVTYCESDSIVNCSNSLHVDLPLH